MVRQSGVVTSQALLTQLGDETEVVPAQTLRAQLDDNGRQAPEDENEEMNDVYLIDSGATANFTNEKAYFKTLTLFEVPRKVYLSDESQLQAIGEGTLRLTLLKRDRQVEVEVPNALWVPKIKKNLLAVSRLVDDGFKISVDQSGIKLRKGSETILAERRNGLYAIKVAHPTAASNQISTSSAARPTVSLKEGHKVLSHVGKQSVKEALEQEGFDVLEDLEHCDLCARAKQVRSTFRSRPQISKAERPGTFHLDLCKMDVPTAGGAHYFMAATDEFSGFRRVYLLKDKMETTQAI